MIQPFKTKTKLRQNKENESVIIMDSFSIILSKFKFHRYFHHFL